MRKYISDLHFYHANLNTRMDQRGFASISEMHQHMIKQWNSKTEKNDEVIVIGDFSWGNWEETKQILEQLNGKIYLIKGNHDKWVRDKEADIKRFGWIRDYAELNDNKRKVILSHYPIFCYNGQYRLNEDGTPKTYMLYGHVHNTMDQMLIDKFIRETRETLRKARGFEKEKPIPCHMINCFCMFSNYVPLTLDEWIEAEEKRFQKVNEGSWKYSG